MTRPRNHFDGRRRSGAALLIVLATLVIVVVAAGSLARSAGTAAIQRRDQDRQRATIDLLTASEAVIQHWLAKESASVVLPPDAIEPSVDVLHDRIQTGGAGAGAADSEALELHIRAFDQCGMVPLELARAGSPLRLSLRSEWTVAVDEVDITLGDVAGLDMFTSKLDEDNGGSVSHVVFPAAYDVIVNRHGDIAGQFIDAMPDNGVSEHPTPALGALIATHNLSAVVNINTAPPDLIEAAMRVAGMTAPGGIEAIIAARSEGKPAPAPVSGTSGNGGAGAPHDASNHQVRLAGVSSIWSFRIDACAGTLRQSWWATYTKTGSKWECVQRLAITE
jgi:hypothetical protein